MCLVFYYYYEIGGVSEVGSDLIEFSLLNIEYIFIYWFKVAPEQGLISHLNVDPAGSDSRNLQAKQQTLNYYSQKTTLLKVGARAAIKLNESKILTYFVFHKLNNSP